jgi:PPOX class probable F420-dependent enzyme
VTTADQVAHSFDALRNEQFVVLTTFRRNGEPMPTAVWFAELNGIVFITTNNRAGKVKRINNNPHVTIAPSDRVGTVHGPAIEVRARLLSPEEAQLAADTLHAKYGDMYVQVTAQMDSGAAFGHRVFLELVAP